MKRAILVVLTLLFFSTAVWAEPASEPIQVPSQPPQFTEAEKTLLDEGKPVKRSEAFKVDGNRAGRGLAYIRIKGTPDDVWKQVLDYDRYIDFYPYVEYSKLYKQEGSLYFAKFTLNMAKVAKITYHCRHVFDKEAATLTWTLDDTQENEFKKTIGFWKIWKVSDTESLLCYSIYIDSGRFVPGFIQNLATGYGLTTVAESMKKRVESGGTYKR
jgi:ribosome-associated toxin RatA of RatAB toxin-antitoxin module